MQDPPVAAIDLGTKSVLMVIGQRTEKGIRIIVDAQGSLSQEAMDRACHQITIYSEIALRLGVQTIAAWGTSALRDAVNRQLLIERVFKEKRINLRPLSGEQEALPRSNKLRSQSHRTRFRCLRHACGSLFH